MATYKKNDSSTWADKLSSIYDTIQNRKPFSYNQQEDPMYRQYQEMYERNAKLAQDNAVGQATALSGGYSNSYAETAGQAMYNQAMNGLNEKALDLANAAQNRYQMETDNLLNQYQMAGQMYSNAYQQERDAISDQRYADEFAYQKQRDSVADSQWQKNYDYQKARDDISDDRYESEWKYQKERDSVSDKQNEQSLAYQYAMNGYTKDKNGNWVYTGTPEMLYNLGRAAQSDSEFEKELEYKYKAAGYEKDDDGDWTYTGVGQSEKSPYDGMSESTLKNILAGYHKEGSNGKIIDLMDKLYTSGNITEEEANYYINHYYNGAYDDDGNKKNTVLKSHIKNKK